MCPLRGAVVRVPPARAAEVPLKATVLKTIEGKQKSRGEAAGSVAEDAAVPDALGSGEIAGNVREPPHAAGRR